MSECSSHRTGLKLVRSAGQSGNRLKKRFLEEVEGVRFEPTIHRITYKGFRDRRVLIGR
jgi:hypothetical protein